MSHLVRKNVTYLAALLATIALGLLWRSRVLPLSPAIAKYGGDALWALMIYWGVRFLAPPRPTWQNALVALAICFLVETSQLLHAPWLDALRATRLGHLLLGSTFNWPDFRAYALGVAWLAA